MTNGNTDRYIQCNRLIFKKKKKNAIRMVSKRNINPRARQTN